MDYLKDYYDVSKIEQGGWTGSRVVSDKGYVIFTATNGWRTFGWSLEEIVGKDIVFEFDYQMTDISNLGHAFIAVCDTLDYGSSTAHLTFPVNEFNVWKHAKFHISNAKKFIGFNLRGVDNTGLSLVCNMKNIRIYDDVKSTPSIKKTGIFISENITETNRMSITSNGIYSEEFYEI